MKRRFVSIFLLGLFLLPPLCAHAAGTAVIGAVEKIFIHGQVERVVIPITFTADGSAAMATVDIDPDDYGIKGWYLYLVKTNPGTTGPTNGAWDFDLTDAQGFVQTRTLVDNRSSTAPQEVVFTTVFPMILNTWTASIGDNTVNNAVAVVYLVFSAK